MQQAKALEPYIPEEDEEVIEQATETIAKALIEEISRDILPAYKPVKPAAVKDTLDGQFIIQTNRPLPEFSTQQVKAYAASDSENNSRNLFAMVCSTQIPARSELAKELKKKPHASLLNVVASGVVYLSLNNEERYVIIYEKPLGRTLASIVAEQIRPLPERYIIEKIISPLAAALNHIEEMGFTHGRLNPNNVFFHEYAILGDCCSEPCGFSQDFHYEPIGRLQVLPTSGKGTGKINNDFHALATLVAFLKFKPAVLNEPEQTRFLFKLLQEGAYIGIIGYRDLSEEMSDFFRGCLHDSPYERWTYKQTKQWLSGKRYNLLPPSLPSSGSRPFEFMGQNYSNLRTLSAAMQQHWIAANFPLRDGSLARWIEVGMRRKDIADNVHKAVKSLGGSISRTDKQNSELVARTIVLMDPVAPLRIKNVSCFVDGIGMLLADAYIRKDEGSIAIIVEMIEQALPSIWADSQRRYLPHNEDLPDDLQKGITTVDRARITMRANGYGFGIERIIYDLNPDLPCMSQLFKGRYVTSVEQLLVNLDEMASGTALKEVAFDRHIAAYIASKLSISRELIFSEFRGYPDLQKNKAMLALKFLQLAQTRSGNLKLAGLTSWVVVSIAEIVATWQSKSIRTHVCQNLKNMAVKGSLTPILDFFTKYDYTQADNNGFMHASRSYHEMAQEIIDQQDDIKREIRAIHFGSIVAKGISYAIFMSVILYFFFGD